MRIDDTKRLVITTTEKIMIYEAKKSTMSKVKALIMGESGAGKSHLIATSPSPLIVLTEPNGAASVAASNPNALIVHCHNLSEFYTVLNLIKAGQTGHEFDTVVIDSITELQRFFIDYIQGDSDKMTLQDYGKLAQQFSKCIRDVIKLDYHIVCTALCSVELEEEKTRHLYPLLTGKLRFTIQQYFSGVGYLYQTGKTDDAGFSQRALLLDGHDRIKPKAFPNTKGTILQPHLTDIFSTVIKGLD